MIGLRWGDAVEAGVAVFAVVPAHGAAQVRAGLGCGPEALRVLESLGVAFTGRIIVARARATARRRPTGAGELVVESHCGPGPLPEVIVARREAAPLYLDSR